MVQGPSSQTIDAILSSSLDDQIASLKQLKNDIVGHDQRKELVVKQGLLQPLVHILTAPSKGKRTANGVGLQQSASTSWTPEDEARLQATLILGSLAGAGAGFVKPLLAAGAAKGLVDGLTSDTSPRLTTATLQALRNLAASATESKTNNTSAEQSTPIFESLMKQPGTTSAAKQQQKLAADIITCYAEDESVKTELTNCRFLEFLASLLVSYTVEDSHIDYNASTPQLPLPPPPSIENLPSVISTISAIIEGSNFRAQSFILSPPIRDLLTSSGTDTDGPRFVFNSRQSLQSPIGSLLPPLHVPIYKSVSFNPSSSVFPALASLQPDERRSGPGVLGFPILGGDADHANAVVGWLIYLARSMQGFSRLTALRLLAQVNQATEADAILVPPRTESLQRARERERQIAMLAIPLVVKLVQSASEDGNLESASPIDRSESRKVQEQACEVLAKLVQGSKDLQAAAVDAGAVKRVCSFLKQSFDNITIPKPLWSATGSSNAEHADVPESCKMGSRGLAPEIRHVMLCRRGALEALAALASKEDIHRKAIVDAGVVTCIIDSLRPIDSESALNMALRNKKIPVFSAKDGNTTDVVLAACHAAQSITRSVNALRTSLVDGGIAKPTFELVKHSNHEVQLAATNVCCNLLLDFSPMREELVAIGAIPTLTEHARQSEMKLRVASLWALKHLILSSSKDVKIQILDELGAGWLVGALQGQHGEVAPELSSITSGGVSIATGGLSAPNAAGEQVELLNPATSMDVDDPGDDEDDVLEEEEEDEDEDGEVMYDEAARTHYQASQLRSTLQRLPRNTFSSISGGFDPARYLSSVREAEQNPILQAKRDDVAVQEQALDFVRNMLSGDDNAAVFEHLLRTIGQDKVFSLLSDKLAPITTTNSSAHRGKPVYQPTELILSTIHVLTHIANGLPTHKQFLIAQKQLLANWLPHFNHHDRRVRVMSVWTVNSLTWVEDDADRGGAMQRAKELRLCGIEQAIRGLQNDPDLDVRERVKTAMRQIEAL